MDKFVVTGIPAFNGDYPIDIGSFTMRELQIIKRMSGVRAGELEEAFSAGDSTLILAIAVIAVRRNGRDWESFEKIAWEVDLGSITFETDDEPEEVADEAAPLTPSPPHDADGTNSGTPETSGSPSETGGESTPEKNLRAIGGQH